MENYYLFIYQIAQFLSENHSFVVWEHQEIQHPFFFFGVWSFHHWYVISTKCEDTGPKKREETSASDYHKADMKSA